MLEEAGARGKRLEHDAAKEDTGTTGQTEPPGLLGKIVDKHGALKHNPLPILLLCKVSLKDQMGS
jgi:hypothetical protein